jgi:hypothetical protein
MNYNQIRALETCGERWNGLQRNPGRWKHVRKDRMECNHIQGVGVRAVHGAGHAGAAGLGALRLPVGLRVLRHGLYVGVDVIKVFK